MDLKLLIFQDQPQPGSNGLELWLVPGRDVNRCTTLVAQWNSTGSHRMHFPRFAAQPPPTIERPAVGAGSAGGWEPLNPRVTQPPSQQSTRSEGLPPVVGPVWAVAIRTMMRMMRPSVLQGSPVVNSRIAVFPMAFERC